MKLIYVSIKDEDKLVSQGRLTLESTLDSFNPQVKVEERRETGKEYGVIKMSKQSFFFPSPKRKSCFEILLEKKLRETEREAL